jgi:hypothetical protein
MKVLGVVLRTAGSSKMRPYAEYRVKQMQREQRRPPFGIG